MMDFDKELKLFKEFCNIPALSDEDISQRWKYILRNKIYNTFVTSKDEPITFETARSLVTDSIDELSAWIDTKENYETFKKNKGFD